MPPWRCLSFSGLTQQFDGIAFVAAQQGIAIAAKDRAIIDPGVALGQGRIAMEDQVLFSGISLYL